MSKPFQVVIPARYESARLPAKVLADIAGKPMIQHVVESASRSQATSIVVATDHDAVFRAVAAFGGTAVMTRTDHESGSDRIAEVCETMGWDAETVVVNVQGDEPTMPHELIDQVAALLRSNDQASMATLCTPLRDHQEMLDPSMVKVVTDCNDLALYFSRAPIPWKRSNSDASLDVSGFSAARRHLGIYAYRSAYIRQFSGRKACALEQLERLEQLRVLWHGERIICANAKIAPPAGVDTAEDLQRIRDYLAR